MIYRGREEKEKRVGSVEGKKNDLNRRSIKKYIEEIKEWKKKKIKRVDKRGRENKRGEKDACPKWRRKEEWNC